MLKLLTLGAGSIAAFVAVCLVFVYVVTGDDDGRSAPIAAASRAGGARPDASRSAVAPFGQPSGTGSLHGQLAGGAWPEPTGITVSPVPEMNPDDRAALDAEGERKREMMKRARRGKPPRSAEDLE